ncbi:hypothetical protein JTE90_021326 [Oedothorax gibbosus]|uniref:Uncharacterized protein n=1 Tax=Oedothorax gibbosus TaxID=931172 RepID=A0AAV6VPC2_9ARAC|nr:hypothetical protein JTE90_021326 [Oedothorax gibbosus]
MIESLENWFLTNQHYPILLDPSLVWYWHARCTWIRVFSHPFPSSSTNIKTQKNSSSNPDNAVRSDNPFPQITRRECPPSGHHQKNYLQKHIQRAIK